MRAALAKILLIGNDSPLTYLITRYADQSGFRIEALEALPSASEVCASKASMLIFPSIEGLEAAQKTIAEMRKYEGLVMVCSSITDEARARELGADYCLIHPLTYESFRAAISAVESAADGRD